MPRLQVRSLVVTASMAAAVCALTVVGLVGQTNALGPAVHQVDAFGPGPQAPPRAKTLAEFIRRYDSSSCRKCHEKIYAQWEKSHHATPLIGYKGDLFIATHVPVADPARATLKTYPCFKCHLPHIKNASRAVVVEIARAFKNKDKATLRKLGITCIVCHHDLAVVHTRPQPGVLYGNQNLAEHEHPVFKRIVKSPILKDPVQCGQCHGQGPNLEFTPPVQCGTLYGSYLHAYIPSGGTRTCQDCHMPRGDHSFPPNFTQPASVSARLKKSVRMGVRVLAYRSQVLTPGRTYPLVVVEARITSRAGHRLPDG